jgi:hypothetical protein
MPNMEAAPAVASTAKKDVNLFIIRQVMLGGVAHCNRKIRNPKPPNLRPFPKNPFAQAPIVHCERADFSQNAPLDGRYRY